MNEQVRLITNKENHSFYNEIRNAFDNCIGFYFSVAFINYSGLQLIIDEFEELRNKGICGQIITTDYLTFTDPKALRKLKGFSNIDTTIYLCKPGDGFHTKGYIFEYADSYKVFIGSSNMTQSAFLKNEEWNVSIVSKKDTDLVFSILNEFNLLKNSANSLTDDFLDMYESFHKEMLDVNKKNTFKFKDKYEIKPNKMQQEAVSALCKLRERNENKGLVISATATGKTYMSAFDVKDVSPKTMLFVVHNENILMDALTSYKKIIKDKKMGLFTGNRKEIECDYLFATIQTISQDNHLNSFPNDYFEYIIFDECHRISASSYQKVLNYFKPKFILGMTATPERTDSANIFEIFDYNIPVEIRLRTALEYDLVAPFHYFGISDATVDLENVNIDDIDKLAELLNIKTRVDFIIEKMEFYGFSGRKRKCLGFCVNIKHAEYMAEEFNKFGYKAIFLTGSNSSIERDAAIKRLNDDNDELEFIFTVDVFNEGVDIKGVNLVLMLRPTTSAIIFTQQLGRGLRKAEGKEFLTVLDFIGNHNKSFLIPIALSGSNYYDKDSLKVSTVKDFVDVPGCTNIKFDKMAKEKILKQLEAVSFNNLAYLKSEYLEFKKNCRGMIPKLINYVGVENAPNPMKFITYAGTYLIFLSKIKEIDCKTIASNSDMINVLDFFSKLLPVVRVSDFVIAKTCILNGKNSVNMLLEEVQKYTNGITEDDINHACEHLSGLYFDSSEIKKYPGMFVFKDGYISLSNKMEIMLNNNEYKDALLDTIEYGILYYNEKFKGFSKVIPFFKLYGIYKMRDMALCCNYRKIHSSIRGQGVWRIGEKAHALFVNLHKNSNIKESIDYKDKFIDQETFQWQSPNNTRINSDLGKDYSDNINRGVNIHLFVRKSESSDSVILPFIYLGKVNAISHEGEKPITIIFKFENKIPNNLYDDLTFLTDI